VTFKSGCESIYVRTASGESTSTECGRVHHCTGLLHFLGEAQQSLRLLIFACQVCEEHFEVLRAHNKVVSILESVVENSNEENKTDFRLVISANMSDMAGPRRRYNATAANEATKLLPVLLH